MVTNSHAYSSNFSPSHACECVGSALINIHTHRTFLVSTWTVKRLTCGSYANLPTMLSMVSLLLKMCLERTVSFMTVGNAW